MYADSDSSLFSKSPEFPTNYIQHIRDMLKSKFVLCSTHQAVRVGLLDGEIPYTLIYPERRCMDEYLNRYKNRGSPDAFVELMRSQWDYFLNQLESDAGCVDRIVLGPGEYIETLPNGWIGQPNTRKIL